jgi:hypothetical protein
MAEVNQQAIRAIHITFLLQWHQQQPTTIQLLLMHTRSNVAIASAILAVQLKTQLSRSLDSAVVV